MNIYRFLFMIGCTAILVSCNSSRSAATGEKQRLTQYVNPFVGTTPLTDSAIVGFNTPEGWRPWSGLTYPGSSLPNAMVQLSPITQYGSGAGYQYEDSTIIGFAHTNKGHWNLCNVPVLPLSAGQNGSGPFASSFSHEKESAAPGFYEVYLRDFGIHAELSSTLRCGFHRYTYDAPEGRKILFDLARANNRVRSWKIDQDGSNAVKGFQDVGNDKIYFYARFNTNISQLDINRENDKEGRAIVHLNDGEGDLEMKIGLSFTSMENARANLDAEIGDKSFEVVKKEADETWEALLAHITVEGGTAKQRNMFYSSLYRAFLWPALRSDISGEYSDVKGNVVKSDFNYYTVPSLWDTYRNKLVLLAMISPEVTADVIRSLTDIGEKTGFVPTFFHGDHAASFIAGSYARGITGFDAKKAYELLLRNAFVEGPSRPHLAEYMAKGFISDPDVERPHVETKARAGVSKTLEYAYDDYALAQMAKAFNDEANYQKLMARSKNYRNVFDSTTNFMRGKLANGEWVKNFDPQYPYYEYMYREANAWQVSFFAPHDTKGLIDLYGGNDVFEKKLDSLFTVPWNPDHIARNVETMIGQYCHGNQPDHEAPFAYHFIGKPQKSQEMIDFILNERYGMGKEGLDLSGMDDAGEMSSWYVFGAMGFYPYCAADPEYLVTVPLFDEVRWKLSSGKEFVLKQDKKGRRLQTIRVNGKEQQGYFIPHDLFVNGGEVEIGTR